MMSAVFFRCRQKLIDGDKYHYAAGSSKYDTAYNIVLSINKDEISYHGAGRLGKAGKKRKPERFFPAVCCIIHRH